MSIQAMSEVWGADVTPAQAYVLLAVADTVNDAYENEFWMSSAALASKVGMERRNVCHRLAELVELGWIEVVAREPGTPTRYRWLGVGRQNPGGGSREPGGGSSEPDPLFSTETQVIRREPNPAPPARKARARDVVWDALMAVCGVDLAQVTGSARGAYNRATKDLREVGATPEVIAARGMVFRERWPDVSLTPTALARRWGECDPDRQHRRIDPNTAMLERMMAEEQARTNGLPA